MLSKSATFLDFQLSQGIVATYCRWGRNLCDVYIENFLINQLVNEFWKLVHICQSYCQTWRIMLFETQCIRQYRKTSDSSRAPDTGRGFKWIVPVEAGSRVQAGSGCKLGESWYLLTYRSQPALTSANMASPKVLKRRLTCTDRSRVPVIRRVLDTGRGLKWIVPIEAGGFYPRFYGNFNFHISGASGKSDTTTRLYDLWHMSSYESATSSIVNSQTLLPSMWTFCYIGCQCMWCVTQRMRICHLLLLWGNTIITNSKNNSVCDCSWLHFCVI